MKTFTKAEYPNLLTRIPLTHQAIENAIRSYDLSFPQSRESDVEWGMSFPMFVDSFYSFIISKGQIPTQNDFWEYYLHTNREFFSNNGFEERIIIGLKARAFRTYPSLVRDVHFAKYLMVNMPLHEIIYNIDLDTKEGIDLIIIYNNRSWGINLYTDTRRAYIGRSKKVYRHVRFDNVDYVELPVEFHGSLKCGNFFLYGETEFQRILTAIG